MQNYSLVAVSHELLNGQDDRLMSSACMARFNAEVLPLITDRSLLLCEGFNNEKLVSPDHPRYALLHKGLLDLPDSVRPTFGGCDFRQKSSVALNDEDGQRYDLWEVVCKDIILTDWAKRPRSIEEILDLLKTKEEVWLSRLPTPAERELARWNGAESRKFDRLYLEAMNKHGRPFDQCMFIGGSTHVVAMALRSGYPVIDLISADNVWEVYFAYLASYDWARLVHQAKP